MTHAERDEPREAVVVGRRAVRAARTSVVVASALAATKLVAAILSGSVALAASFVDSLMDVFASSVNLVAVRVGRRPPDEEHGYGHGKAEGLAGMFQGAIIGLSGVYLVVESARRLFAGAVLEHEGLGIAVMGFSCVSSALLTAFLRREARAVGSVALRADSAHYATDVGSNLGVLAALGLVRATGWTWVDPVVGLAVSLFIFSSGYTVVRGSLDELMDRSLGTEIEDEIRAVVARAVPEAREVKEVRTRRAGGSRFVDLVVAFDRSLAFAEAHRHSERVKAAVRAALPDAVVQVHADPHPFRPEDLG